MTAEEHIERARELAAQAEERIEELWSIERAIALGRLHAEIAHADATSTVAYYTGLKNGRP